MNVLTKARLRDWTALHEKKERYAQGLFLAEGIKTAGEALTAGWELEALVLREGTVPMEIPGLAHADPARTFVAGERDYARLSGHQNPEGALAVMRIPGPERLQHLRGEQLPDGPALAPAFLLDHIQDPGNLGTLIRTADWFGFRAVYCTQDTADCLNPKVVRSSMGSLFRVRMVYVEAFADLVQQWADQIQAADLEGEAPGSPGMQARPLILLGNEARGLSPGLLAAPGLRRVCIPRIGAAESLNAAQAGAILAYALTR